MNSNHKPAEPRTWAQIEAVPDDISDAVTVEGVDGTWYRIDSSGIPDGLARYQWERTGQVCTVLQLRQIGNVHEVLNPQ